LKLISLKPFSLFICLKKNYNITQPAWLTEQTYHDMMYLANIGFDFDYYTIEMAKLTSGFIF
jgi:hypothetical protein